MTLEERILRKCSSVGEVAGIGLIGGSSAAMGKNIARDLRLTGAPSKWAVGGAGLYGLMRASDNYKAAKNLGKAGIKRKMGLADVGNALQEGTVIGLLGASMSPNRRAEVLRRAIGVASGLSLSRAAGRTLVQNAEANRALGKYSSRQTGMEGLRRRVDGIARNQSGSQVSPRTMMGGMSGAIGKRADTLLGKVPLPKTPSMNTPSNSLKGNPGSVFTGNGSSFGRVSPAPRKVPASSPSRMSLGGPQVGKVDMPSPAKLGKTKMPKPPAPKPPPKVAKESSAARAYAKGLTRFISAPIRMMPTRYKLLGGAGLAGYAGKKATDPIRRTARERVRENAFDTRKYLEQGRALRFGSRSPQIGDPRRRLGVG